MSVHSVKQFKSSVQCFVQWLLKDNFDSSELLRIDQVPSMFREPFIYTGYRPLYRSWKYYVHSVLHLHNETINVWTHFIGFFVILFFLAHTLKDCDVVNDSTAWPIITYGLSTLILMANSTVAHLLHSKSPWHHHLMFLLDYVGVAVHGYGVGVAGIHISSSAGFRDACQFWYPTVNFLISVFVFLTYCKARINFAGHVVKRKSLMMSSIMVQGIFLTVPVVPRYTSCLSDPDCSLSSLNHISLVFFLDVMCAITFGAHAPERWVPGRCDLIGHSHQIFHVFAVMTMSAKLVALRHDLDTLDIPREPIPSLAFLLASFGALLLVHGLVYRYFLQYIKSVPSSKKRKIK